MDGCPVLGKTEQLEVLKETDGVEAIYCLLGNNMLRVKFLERARHLGYVTPNYIHPSVIIAPNVSIANEGIYILQQTWYVDHVSLMTDLTVIWITVMKVLKRADINEAGQATMEEFNGQN